MTELPSNGAPPALSLGTSTLIRRFSSEVVAEIAHAASANDFVQIDVSPEWGPLAGLSSAGLPAVVRIPPIRSWAIGEPPPIASAYPEEEIARVLAETAEAGLTASGVLLHKWDGGWSGSEISNWLCGLRDRLASDEIDSLGVACPDSDPWAATSVASLLDVVSVQVNLANQKAVAEQSIYEQLGCKVEARAPFDAGSLLPNFFDTAEEHVRRRYFRPFEVSVRECASFVEAAAMTQQLSVATLAVRWVASHPWVSRICVGATSVGQVAEIADAIQAGPLPLEQIRHLQKADWSWRYD